MPSSSLKHLDQQPIEAARPQLRLVPALENHELIQDLRSNAAKVLEQLPLLKAAHRLALAADGLIARDSTGDSLDKPAAVPVGAAEIRQQLAEDALSMAQTRGAIYQQLDAARVLRSEIERLAPDPAAFDEAGKAVSAQLAGLADLLPAADSLAQLTIASKCLSRQYREAVLAEAGVPSEKELTERLQTAEKELGALSSKAPWLQRLQASKGLALSQEIQSLRNVQEKLADPLCQASDTEPLAFSGRSWLREAARGLSISAAAHEEALLRDIASEMQRCLSTPQQIARSLMLPALRSYAEQVFLPDLRAAGVKIPEGASDCLKQLEGCPVARPFVELMQAAANDSVDMKALKQLAEKNYQEIANDYSQGRVVTRAALWFAQYALPRVSTDIAARQVEQHFVSTLEAALSEPSIASGLGQMLRRFRPEFGLDRPQTTAFLSAPPTETFRVLLGTQEARELFGSKTLIEAEAHSLEQTLAEAANGRASSTRTLDTDLLAAQNTTHKSIGALGLLSTVLARGSLVHWSSDLPTRAQLTHALAECARELEPSEPETARQLVVLQNLVVQAGEADASRLAPELKHSTQQALENAICTLASELNPAARSYLVQNLLQLPNHLSPSTQPFLLDALQEASPEVQSHLSKAIAWRVCRGSFDVVDAFQARLQKSGVGQQRDLAAAAFVLRQANFEVAATDTEIAAGLALSPEQLMRATSTLTTLANAGNQTTAEFLRLGPYRTSSDIRLALEDLAALPNVSALSQTVAALEPFGFKANAGDSELLAQLCQNQDSIQASLQAIRQVLPEYRYQPHMVSTGRGQQQWQIDPYALALGSFRSEPSTVVALLEQCQARHGSLSPDQLQAFARTSLFSHSELSDTQLLQLQENLGPMLQSLSHTGTYSTYLRTLLEQRDVLGMIARAPACAAALTEFVHEYVQGIILRPVHGTAQGSAQPEQAKSALEHPKEFAQVITLAAKAIPSLQQDSRVALSFLRLAEQALAQAVPPADYEGPQDQAQQRENARWQKCYQLGEDLQQLAVLARDPKWLDACAHLLERTNNTSLLYGLAACHELMTAPQDVTRLGNQLDADAKNLGAHGDQFMRTALSACRARGLLQSEADLQAAWKEATAIVRQGLSSRDWGILAGLLAAAASSSGGSPGNSITTELGTLRSFVSEYGAVSSPALYTLYRSLQHGELPPQAQENGIDQTGASGLRQLKQSYLQFRSTLHSIPQTLRLDSELEADMLAAAVGYHEAQWGTSEQSLQERVNAFNQAVAAGLVAPDWKELKPGQITVRQMEQDALKEFKLLPQCITRCEELAADLRLAQRYSPKQMLENARAELVSGLAARSSELRAALSPEEQARDSQGRRAKARLLEADRVDALQRSCAGSESPEALTLALLDFERKDDALTTKHIRRLVLSKALSQITLPQEVQAALDSAQVSTNSVAALAEFFGDTIRNQILPQLFQSGLNTGDNKPLERRALQVFGVQALLDDVQRFSRSAAGNPETIGVYPTRGIIGELSGYLCDTCWAPLMQLLQNNPNITFLAFVANPETPSARLVGGSLLIRAQDQQGNTHWIVRGLNPRQNYATAVSASDLCEQLIDSYLTPQARAAGVRTIDAPNDGLGGATTNRPPIAAHFATQYLAAPALEGLRDQAELHFNGYAIQNECRVLRQLGGSVRK